MAHNLSLRVIWCEAEYKNKQKTTHERAGHESIKKRMDGNVARLGGQRTTKTM